METYIKEYRANFTVPDSDKDKLLLGLEFEFELPDGSQSRLNDIAYRISRSFPDLILKYDSSLHNGFEVITKPNTIDYYRNKFDWRFLSALNASGMKIPDTSGERGVHVHVNKAPLGDSANVLHFMKWMRILGVTQKSRQSTTIAPTTNYIDWGGNYESRYSAVNERKNTVEVRFWRYSFDKNVVLSYLTATDAVARSFTNNTGEK
jgi:hypothetical protein